MRLNFFSYMGGKFYLLDKLLKLIPSHETYIEPFGGSAKLLLNKPPSKVEIYNDADIRLANLFYVVSNEATFNEFYEKVNRLVYSRVLLKELYSNIEVEKLGDVNKAICFYYYLMTNFASQPLRYSFGYSFTRNEAFRFVNSVKKLPVVHERLKNILTFNESYDIILEKYVNDVSVFVYLDPPYYGAEHYYKIPFTRGDHERMLNLLKQAKFKWLLSGYDNNLYNKELRDFYRMEISSFKPSYGITKHSKYKKRPKSQEILWSNYAGGFVL